MVAPTHATGKNVPLSVPAKNVGADSISARARLRQDKLPRAHIECAPTDFVFDQREKTPRGAPPAGGEGENRAAGRNISGLDCQKIFVGASIARPCPLALQENCPGKCVAAVSWRATNGRPYTRNREKRAPLRPHKKRRGGFHIPPCPLAAGQTSAGAYRMRPYGFRFRPTGTPTKKRSHAILR